MVWNNNQQTHGAPGKISQPPPTPPPPSVREEGRPPSDSPRQCLFSGFTQGATQRRNTQEPKRAFGVHMIKSQTSDSPSEKKKCVRANPCIVKLHSGCALEWLR